MNVHVPLQQQLQSQSQDAEISSSSHCVWTSNGDGIIHSQAHEHFRELCCQCGFFDPPQHLNHSKKFEEGRLIQMSLVRFHHGFAIIVCELK